MGTPFGGTFLTYPFPRFTPGPDILTTVLNVTHIPQSRLLYATLCELLTMRSFKPQRVFRVNRYFELLLGGLIRSSLAPNLWHRLFVP
ncbi:hypothetical protein HJTV-2_gp137 [Haloarcula virus HJTV-2]|uniref:Uncharacterized protein n=1 Tax=Haloarcula virus HJTV-2 TaxID=2877986 RepID=A0AAE8XX31_9CAUD|nr:hypothetical protein M1M33_gp010 [Haloarcula virus HJTV-2]UBF21617.1 hypothetical protein HRTV-24_gp131 [Halorubrum virus HRTV-24]UBF21886.1 hypothetical protein HSTV-3_gp126 [Halorubrum virus HSTV-3]UBF22016.1 hypothetical protein HJTV-3_gp127 [Haloarcula virus HJTV-3]UBF22145.1 hypothetical protein HRTV-15_gp126 [Halorubrum virus HRTV-15]UBF21757.1 hypothetical protein HJTV-2_gp137 [Haloarcula virus HJTV-2]